MFSLVEPDAWVCLRLPSDTLKVVQITPNTTISLGKYGAFQSNLVISRPYHLTYEIRDRVDGAPSSLRIVPASEIHADTIAEEEAAANPSASSDTIPLGGDGVQFELVNPATGEVLMRSNRETIDDAARQTMTMEEIEILKRDGSDAGKDLIAKLMLSHTALDEKTAFSLAKYKLLKTKKYLRRFTVLPLDVPMLTHWLIEQKDAARILEMRDEILALVGCWANVHFSGDPYGLASPSALPGLPAQGRWLVVDEVGGLLVAAMAERMGILYPSSTSEPTPQLPTATARDADEADSVHDTLSHPPSSSNTLTLLHPNAQPNLSLLKYFHYNPDAPTPSHPLSSHLLSLSWLQLISPSSDSTYSTAPPSATPAELQAMKSGKRGQYYRKRRRYTRVHTIVDSTRAGSFDGLVVASPMDPVTILQHLVPLLHGGAPIAVYSPNVEPLTRLADCYSTSRRTAFITSPPADGDLTQWSGTEDFPLNPTLLLGASVQTSRVREWQVLPGRTHPLMTSRGGAEGYVFTATRVIPAEGKVEARGKYKKRKVEEGSAAQASGVETPEVVETKMEDVVVGENVTL